MNEGLIMDIRDIGRSAFQTKNVLKAGAISTALLLLIQAYAEKKNSNLFVTPDILSNHENYERIGFTIQNPESFLPGVAKTTIPRQMPFYTAETLEKYKLKTGCAPVAFLTLVSYYNANGYKGIMSHQDIVSSYNDILSVLKVKDGEVLGVDKTTFNKSLEKYFGQKGYSVKFKTVNAEKLDPNSQEYLEVWNEIKNELKEAKPPMIEMHLGTPIFGMINTKFMKTLDENHIGIVVGAYESHIKVTTPDGKVYFPITGRWLKVKMGSQMNFLNSKEPDIAYVNFDKGASFVFGPNNKDYGLR